MKNTPNAQVLIPVTIANGSPYSTPIDNRRVGLRGFGVCLDSAWTAARIAVQVTDKDPSNPGVVWRFLRDDEANLIVISGIPTSANASLFSCPGEVWQIGAWPWFRLVSVNTASEAVVNQGAARDAVVSMVY